jgi:threonine dehydrogenase-like Zn-dependent dehydrogenase
LISEGDVRPGRWDIVLEATGSPDGFALARRAIRPRGRLVMKSTYKGDIQVNFSSIVVDEVTVVGSRCGPFAPALRLMDQNAVDPGVLITAEYKLEDGLAALEEAARPGVLKVILEP